MMSVTCNYGPPPASNLRDGDMYYDTGDFKLKVYYNFGWYNVDDGPGAVKEPITMGGITLDYEMMCRLETITKNLTFEEMATFIKMAKMLSDPKITSMEEIFDTIRGDKIVEVIKG